MAKTTKAPTKCFVDRAAAIHAACTAARAHGADADAVIAITEALLGLYGIPYEAAVTIAQIPTPCVIQVQQARSLIAQRMVRPAWEEIGVVRGYVICNCGSTLQSRQMLREHWQLGHFDQLTEGGEGG